MARIVMLYVVLLLALSCKSVEKTKSQTSGKREYAEVALSERVSGTVETFGDTLTGMIPLRALTKIPQVIPVRSSGIELELSITDTSISYMAVARPVARSTLSWESTADTVHVTEEIQESSSYVEKKGFQFPWWVWAVGIVAVVLAVLMKFYNPFKRF